MKKNKSRLIRRVARAALSLAVALSLVSTTAPSGVVAAFAEALEPSSVSASYSYTDSGAVDAGSLDAVDGDGEAVVAMTEPDLADAAASIAETGDDAATEADGSKIESLSIEWVTSDTADDGDESRLSLAPSSDDEVLARARVNFALSGLSDYDVGTVSIVLPKNIFADRDGEEAGTVTLSVPEAPDSKALFSYAELDDGYVLTNTKKLSAATSALLEVSYTGLVPHKMCGNPEKYVSDRLSAQLSVTTSSGAVLSAASNEIDCAIDTSESAQAAYNRVYSKTGDDDYVYVDFYSYAAVSGNQQYRIEVRHDTSGSDVAGEVVSMTYLDGEAGGADASATISESTYSESGSWDGFVHFVVRFPKGAMQNGETYTLSDTVTYTVTGLDDEVVTTASAAAQSSYRLVPYQEPEGSWGVSKYGVAATSGRVGNNNLDHAGNQDYYNGYLNHLLKGKDVEVRYVTYTDGAAGTDTGVDADGDGVIEESELGQLAYTLETADDDVSLDGVGRLSAGDYEFTKLKISNWRYGVYGADEATGEWGYSYSAATGGELEIYATVGGEEMLVATCTVDGGSVTSTCVNGASGTKATITLPQGATGWRAVMTTKKDAASYTITPTVRLFGSSDTVQTQLNTLFDNSDTPEQVLRNTVVGTATLPSGSSFDMTVNGEGTDHLTGATQAVGATKTLTYTNDTSSRQVKLHYTATTRAQSNVTDADQYADLVENGALTQEESGVFYDLVPLDVVVDLDSISPSKPGDTVKSIKTIENYRDTGRTMLIVEMDLTPSTGSVSAASSASFGLRGIYETHGFSYDAVYSWESMAADGSYLDNVVAYESGNSSYGTVKGRSGEPDNPAAGNNESSLAAVDGVVDAMTDLDADRDDPSFVYARSAVTLSVDVSALTSLTKRVSVNGDGVYGDGLGDDALNVYEGGTYSYRLSQTNATNTSLKDIVLYDSLESFKPGDDTDDAGDSQWRGTLTSVDTSQISRAGASPVVYYSTVSDLDLSTQGSADLDLTNSGIWSDSAPGDLSDVTAVAIDARHASDGGDFTLGEGETLTAYIKMLAPDDVEETVYDTDLSDGESEEGENGGAHAYNSASMVGTAIASGTAGVSGQLIWDSYTKVGLVPFEIKATKVWSDGADRDRLRPDSVTVHLYADGVDTGKAATLSDDNGWTASLGEVAKFTDDGDYINYTVAEDAVDGYAASSTYVVADNVGTFTVTNRHTPEKVSLSGEKVWVDDGDAAAARPDSITLTLYKNGVAYKTQTVTGDEGESSWAWSFDGLYRYEDGEEITYTVAEDTAYDGYLSTVENASALDGTAVVTNTYHPYGDLEVTKTLASASPADTDAEFSFVLTVLGEDGQPCGDAWEWERSDGVTGEIATGGTLTLKGGQTATVKELPAGVSYSLKETSASGYTLTSASNISGDIVANETASASFTNTYIAKGYASLSSTKTLSGRELADGQFTFQVLDEDGDVVRTAKNDEDGKVTFGRIKYTGDDAGKTFTYTINEVVPDGADEGAVRGYTYDMHEETVLVTVTDDGDGTLSTDVQYDSDGAAFANGYSADGSLPIQAWKTLTGRDLADGEFTFELKDADGNVVDTATNDENGAIEFDAVEFDQDDAGKTFKYTVSEQAGSDDTVEYDDAVFTYTVTVHDDGDGTLSFDASTDEDPVFENECRPGSLSLTKTADAADPDAEFTLHVQLTPPEGVELDGTDWSYTRDETDQLSGTLTVESASGEPEPGCTLNVVVGSDGTMGEIGADGLTFEWHRVDADGNDEIVGYGRSYATSESDNDVQFYVIASDTSGKVPGYVSSEPVTISKLIAYAVYCADDGSLEFFKRSSVPEVGDTSPSGKTVSAVYSNVESYNGTVSNSAPWFSHRSSITSAAIVDDGIAPISTAGWFSSCSNMTTVDGLNKLDTSKVTSMSYMFRGCRALASLDVSGFDTSKVTSMSSMFYDCRALASLDVSGFDTSKVTSMSYMFYDCQALASLDVSGFDTSKVTSMSYMFRGCQALASLDVSGFDTSSVTDMSYMFRGCQALASLDVSGFDTSSVTDMSSMFCDCRALASLDVSGFDTSSVTDMSYMFYDCRALACDASGWDVSNVTMYTYFNYSAPGVTAPTWASTSSASAVSSPDDDSGDESSLSAMSLEDALDVLSSGSSSIDASPAPETAPVSEGMGSVTVTDGGFDVTLKAGETIDFTDVVPAGTGYVVYEETPAGWVEVGSSATAGVIAPCETSEVVFTNKYSAGSCQATLSATKTMDGEPAPAGAFSFQLLDNSGSILQTVSNSAGGGVAFKPITYDEAGAYTYTIKEVAGSDSTVSYDSHELTATVTVSDDGSGNLSAGVAYTGSTTFANTTKDEFKYGSLTIGKEVTGTDDASKEFTFLVKWNGGQETDTVKLAAGATKTFSRIEAGTSYEVSETDIPDGYSLESITNPSGTIVSDSEGVASVTATNSYSASGSFAPAATKTLSGGELTEGQFDFALYECDAAGSVAPGASPVSTGTNTAAGQVVFEPVDLTQAGTYHYVMTESNTGDDEYTYDDHESLVKVVASDSGDGTLACAVSYPNSDNTFENAVKPATLTVSKTVVDGTTATDGAKFRFTLSLKDADGSGVAGCPAVITDAAGNTDSLSVSDGDTISLADGEQIALTMPADTTYEVSEAAAAGFTSVGTNSSGTLAAGESAACEFTNTYSLAPATFAVALHKTLLGALLADGQFTFELSDESGEVVGTATNDADGNVVFDAVALQAADGATATYYVSEVDDGQDDVVYDATSVKVSVTAHDNGDGTMSATATYADTAGSASAQGVGSGVEGWTFTNKAGVALPTTGLSGMLVALVAGIAALVAAMLALLFRMSRRPKGRHSACRPPR